MARKKMFKQIALVRTENIGHLGASYPVAKLEKQQDQMVAAYVDKVRISYHLDITESGGPGNAPLDMCGITFYVCTNESDPSGQTLVTASSSRGAGGTVTLNVKRAIRDNDYDANSGFNALSIQAETSDLDLQAGDVTLNLVAEAFGRWHTVVTA